MALQHSAGSQEVWRNRSRLSPSWQLCHTKAKTRRDEGPSRVSPALHPASIFPVSHCWCQICILFLSSYLIIFIIKIIFINPACGVGEKDSDSGSTRGGRVEPSKSFCQSTNCFQLPAQRDRSNLHTPSPALQTDWDGQMRKGHPFLEECPCSVVCRDGQGWAGDSFLLLQSLKAPSLAPFQAAGLEAWFCLCSLNVTYWFKMWAIIIAANRADRLLFPLRKCLNSQEYLFVQAFCSSCIGVPAALGNFQAQWSLPNNVKIIVTVMTVSKK